MGIQLFKEVTTDDYLDELQAESEKYQGLYVDMDNALERKYVKDKAALISSLIKKLDGARIDKSRDYKNQVEAEAASIKVRLEEANKPFTLLIDEHTEKRKKILADKKAIEDAKVLVVQIELDHDEAILLNKIFDIDKKEAQQAQIEHDEKIRSEAAQKATKDAEEKAERIEQDRLSNEAKEKAAIEARENDKEHKRIINRRIAAALVKVGTDESLARFIVTAIAKNEIPNVKINY